MTSSADKECCGPQNRSKDKHEQEDSCDGRRDFLIMTSSAVGAVGAAAVAWPMLSSMSPAADVLALASTEVDLAQVKEGESITVMWRGKPVFIRRRTQKEIEEARAAPMSALKDPQSDEDRVKQSVIGGKEHPEWLVMIGVCTHLGCVPLGQKPTDPHGEFDGWFCPCHGSQYDSSGRIRKGPAPKNLEIPPYAFTDATKIKIG
jgi:ubiquinol-cytochrome c reductase iron-sulfur subunit